MRLLTLITAFLLFTLGWRVMFSTANTSGQAYGARTDFAVAPVPSPTPSMGGAHGRGNSISDPDFGSRIYRLTDIDTLPSARYFRQQEWFTSCGGWGAFRVSNLDSTKLFICNNGGNAFVLPFDGLTGKPGTVSPIPGIQGSPEWSKTQTNLAFGISQSRNPEIVQLDFSVLPPRESTIVNLAKVPHCAEQFAGTATWKELSTSWDDATFAMAIGNGAQGSAHMVYVWNTKTGCQTYDTEARTVNGSPVQGSVESFFVHSIRMSGDGKVVVVTPSGGISSRRFWYVGSTRVENSQSDVNNGHFAMGHHSILNAGGYTSDGKWCKLGMSIRALTALSSPFHVLGSKQCGDTLAKGDDHVSWNNDDTTDQRPFATSTVTVPLGSAITAPWQNEILIFMHDGTVHREAHTFNSGKSRFFSCQNAIGSISQDGKWFFFSSDWEGGLGTDKAGNLRCDDFAVALR